MRIETDQLAQFKIEPQSISFLPDPFSWCWKRDEGEKSRTIFYKPHFHTEGDRVVLDRADFYYYQGGFTDPFQYSHNSILDYIVERNSLLIRTKTISPESQEIIDRLLQQKPKINLPEGVFPKICDGDFLAKPDQSIVLYCGAGVSYESGLPTLADIHEFFGVDDPLSNRFTFGVRDPVLAALSNPRRFFIDAFGYHLQFANAEPSYSHTRLAELYREGYFSRILTDNIDKLFEKTGVETTRVRQIFPMQIDITFKPDEKTLLVIGVAADRRGVIKCAREQGLSVVVVNPHYSVSPRAQNLSYLSQNDIWFKERSENFLRTRLVATVP